MTASSQMISSHFCSIVAKSELTGMLHVESLSTLSGIRKIECAVIPPSSRDAAIPDVATAIAILPSDLILASNVL